jgi:organic radical activating enzyme
MADEYNDKLHNMREALNEIGPGMCLAKWTQVTTHLGSGITHSCHHVGAHKIKLDELAKDPGALHNTEFKKERRQEMKTGQRPVECDYCWRIEDNSDHFSDRIHKSLESWSIQDFAKIKEMDASQNVYPRYVEISFSNVCNFKCAYCGPAFSSKWTEEIKQLGPYLHTPRSGNYKKEFGFINPDEIQYLEKEDNPYVNAFWEWFPEAVKHMSVFRITGGEPLLSKHTMRVLDYLIKHPQPNLEFAINTNACPPAKLWTNFIKKIKFMEDNNILKEIMIFTSAEASGKQNDYIRDGMDYDLWLDNISLLLDKTSKVKLSVMSAFNILSLPSLGQFVDDIDRLKQKYSNRRILIDFPYVRNPRFLDVRIATPDMLDRYFLPVFHKLESSNFVSWEITRLRRIYDSCVEMNLKSDNADTKNVRYNFFEYITQYDKRRNKDFLSTFPQYEQFYRICELSNV